MSVLSEQTINGLRHIRYKFDFRFTRQHIIDLIDTIDHLRAGKPVPKTKDLVEPAKRYLDSLGATHWPTVSWTIKGNDENLNSAAAWLAERVRAVMKEYNNK